MQSSPVAGRTLHRRHLLAAGVTGGAGLLLVGCSGGVSLPIIAPDPDDELRTAVAQSEQLLIAAYTAAIAAQPTLGTRLRPFLDQHEQHLAAVADGLDLATPSGSASNGQAPSVRALRRLEAGAMRQRIDAATAAQDGDLAGLLARIAASESEHVAALGKAGA